VSHNYEHIKQIGYSESQFSMSSKGLKLLAVSSPVITWNIEPLAENLISACVFFDLNVILLIQAPYTNDLLIIISVP